MQILTPDFSGRRPPPLPSPLSPLPSPHPTSPLLLLVFLPPSLPPPSSQVRLRPVVALWHAVSVAYLAAALAHSHCLTVSLSLSLISLISLISQEDPGKEPHIKDSSPLPPKRAPCFFLPRCPPLSHSGALAFAPPVGLKFFNMC